MENLSQTKKIIFYDRIRFISYKVTKYKVLVQSKVSLLWKIRFEGDFQLLLVHFIDKIRFQ